MKVLLDSCISGAAAEPLREAGHDVDWAGAWPVDPGDARILAVAVKEGRVTVILDKDFGELAILQGLPHAGILRLVGFPSRSHGDVTAQVLELYGEALVSGAIVTVSPGRVRIREDLPALS